MVLPSVKCMDKKKHISSKIKKLDPLLPVPPFRWLCIAPSKSGKSTLICNLFRKEYYGKFWKPENIIVISRTVRLDDKIQKIPSKNFFEEWDESILSDVIEQQEIFRANKKKKMPHVLFILDDMLNTDGMSVKSGLNKFIHIARHYNISTIISSQKYTGVPRTMRINSDVISVWRPYGMNEIDSIIEEQINKDKKKQALQIFMDVFKEPFQFIHIDYQNYDLSKRYRKGFNEYLQLY